MLIAEAKGHVFAGVADNEDYLTSAVFGHLRYVPPGEFWKAFLGKAKTAPIESTSPTFFDLVDNEIEFDRYDKLTSHFWPDCPALGQPELALVFEGSGQRPLVVLVEVKLWSPKSGVGKRDQLMRYLQIADALDRLNVATPRDAQTFVLYLTPRESIDEVEASLRAYREIGGADATLRLLRVQWQDLLDAIDGTLSVSDGQVRTILSDIQAFLQRRGLEYFRGFKIPSSATRLRWGCGMFFGLADDETLRLS